jgi:hypothetical protein
VAKSAYEKSSFIGVKRRGNKWHMDVMIQKVHHFVTFDTEVEAAEEYDRMVFLYFMCDKNCIFLLQCDKYMCNISTGKTVQVR